MAPETGACARPSSLLVMNFAICVFLHLPIISLTLNASDVLARRSTSCQRPGKFDEARLALQWSPGICYRIINKSCAVNVDKFTIHGLWPSKVGSNDPSNCCSKPFDSKHIKHLEPKLKEIWMTIFADNENKNFWAHEWKKHGSCSASSPLLSNQTEYFAKSIEAYDRLPLMMWLSEAEITPTAATSDTTYALKDIHSAIESHTNARVYLECKRLPRGISAEPVLTGVHVCLHSDTLSLINCSKDDRAQCGNGRVRFIASNFGPVSSSARSIMLNR